MWLCYFFCVRIDSMIAMDLVLSDMVVVKIWDKYVNCRFYLCYIMQIDWWIRMNAILFNILSMVCHLAQGQCLSFPCFSLCLVAPLVLGQPPWLSWMLHKFTYFGQIFKEIPIVVVQNSFLYSFWFEVKKGEIKLGSSNCNFSSLMSLIFWLGQ